jgi:hypothetical protein
LEKIAEMPWRIIRKLVEKAIDIRLREITGKPKQNNTYLLEEPINLFSCESARLLLGFSVKVVPTVDSIKIEANPESSVRESVYDYIKWRRSRGASALSIESGIKQRSSVQLAPNDSYGHVEELVYHQNASETRISRSDSRNLVDFWRDVYGIEVSPDETPLLKIKLAESTVKLTYPPSTVYFGTSSLFVPAKTEAFISHKKASVVGRIDTIVRKALQELRIGEETLTLRASSTEGVSVQEKLMHELREKLPGRRVEARGSITRLGERLYFFPTDLAFQ